MSLNKIQQKFLGGTTFLIYLGLIISAIYQTYQLIRKDMDWNIYRDSIFVGKFSFPFAVVFFSLFFLFIGLVIFYLVHASKNNKLTADEKTVWEICILFASPFFIPYYFYECIWNDGNKQNGGIQSEPKSNRTFLKIFFGLLTVIGLSSPLMVVDFFQLGQKFAEIGITIVNILLFGTIIIYLIHLVRFNQAIPSSRKPFFVLFIFYGLYIALPIYYYAFIWLDHAPKWIVNIYTSQNEREKTPVPVPTATPMIKRLPIEKILFFGLLSILLIVFAISLTDGINWYIQHSRLAWQFDTRNKVMAPLLITEDTVYFGNENEDHTKPSSFFALDKLTGKEKWSVDMIGPIIGSPAVTKNFVVFATYSGMVYAYDKDTGQKQWEYAPPLEINSKCGCRYNWTNPLVSGNMVFVGNSDQKVYAFDLNTGHILWSYKTSGGIYSSLLVVNKHVIVGTSDAFLYQLNEITGEEISKWQIPNFSLKGQIPDNAGEIEQQIYDQGIIYLYNDSLMAIDANTGQVVWHLGRENQIEVYGPIRVGNDLVYIRSRGNLIAINKKKGNIVWEGKTQDVLSDLTLNGGKIYYGDYDSHINVIDAESGQKIDQYDMHLFDPLSKFQSDVNFDNSPSIVDMIGYLGWNHHIYAIRLDN